MNKKDFILSNEAIASHDYYRIQIHGIIHDISDYAYLSRLYQPVYCGETKASFHKIKIRYYADGTPYIKITEKTYDGKKKNLYLKLDNFIRKDSGWCIHTISCKELKAIC